MKLPTPRALVAAQIALESMSLAPDGELLVYGRREARAGRYRSHLWAIGWQGGRPKRLTSGRVRDTAPTISPDGRRVAFVREPADGNDAPPQIWILPLDDGDAWQLTHMKHGASGPRWSPDGRRLALLAQAGPDRFAVGSTVKGKAPTARRITRLDYRDDEVGLLSLRSHLWVVGARRGARPRQLTHGDYDVLEPAWAPTGDWLAFVADMGSDTNIAPRTQLYCVPASAGEVSELASLAGDAYYPAISPNGRWVAFVGTDVDDPPDEALARLFVASVDGHAPRCLTPDLERSVGCEGWADLVMAEDVPGPLWLDDESLLVLVSDRGRNVPHRADLNGQLEPVIPPGRLVGAALAAASGRIALAAGVDRHATEIYALEPGAADAGAATLRQITRDGSAWQDQFAVPEWEELSIEGPGGPIQVWLASPRDARKTPLPTILAFHGGPTGAWAPGGTMDSTMLCGAGYRVALPNIRGSASFGSDWVAALGGRWGEVDAEDALAVADALVARGMADGQRLGMMGLSYGGYLVQWLAGATDRFGAGVAENGVANLVSGWANSYFGVHYHRHARLGDPLTDEGMQGLWRASPLRNAARIHTPLLILQAEEDRICEPADNEQLFTALKVLDRETEYILYPEEHHELKNYGRPDRRIDRMERHLAWFDRWLRPRATSGGG